MPRKRPKYKIVDYEPDKNFDFTDWFNQIETWEIFQCIDQDILYQLTR